MRRGRLRRIVTLVVLVAGAWLLWRRLWPRADGSSSPDWAPAAPVPAPPASLPPEVVTAPSSPEPPTAPLAPAPPETGHPLGAVRDRLASIEADAEGLSETADGWVGACDGQCPESHPVKAKVRSRLFHLPGMMAYARTNADRCYQSADRAEADGFTRAKR